MTDWDQTDTPAGDAPVAGPPQAFAPAPAAAAMPAPAPAAPASARGGFGRLLAAAVLGGVVGALPVAVGAWVLFGRQVGDAGTSGVPGQRVTVVSKVTTSAIEAAALKVLPSVVNVSVSADRLDVFGGRSQATGMASGVIIRSDGYILTNAHVVSGADRITVRIGKDEEVASVVGADPSTDLAVIRVSKRGLPAAQFGDSQALKVGETVVAFGSPFGLDKTVTSGIVSALNRTNIMRNESGLTAYTNLIQTDAAINPGNSGGALADLTGRVIGINTMIESPSGAVGAAQSAGVGFAIPIEFAKSVADQLIKTGKVQHPFMGVVTTDVSERMRVDGSETEVTGARIEEVVVRSPAEKAGLQVGDIITAMDGNPVTSFADVFAGVRAHAVGEKVEVTVVRDGRTTDVDVTLGTDSES